MTFPDWWAAALLTLAAYRIYHLIALDSILDGPRAWVLRAGDWRPDSNALMPVGFRIRLAEFISCPWCTGFWISGVLVLIYYQAAIPDSWAAAGGAAVTWLAVSAGVGLLAKLD